MSVAHRNQKDRCPAIVPTALFTHKQKPNLEGPSGCFTLAALDQELSSVASVNLSTSFERMLNQTAADKQAFAA